MKAVSHWLSDGVFSSMNVLQYARFVHLSHSGSDSASVYRRFLLLAKPTRCTLVRQAHMARIDTVDMLTTSKTFSSHAFVPHQPL